MGTININDKMRLSFYQNNTYFWAAATVSPRYLCIVPNRYVRLMFDFVGNRIQISFSLYTKKFLITMKKN